MKCYSAFIWLLLLTPHAFAQQQPFVWVDDQDYEPYIYLKTTNEVSGIFHDIMIAVFKKMDIPLSFQLYPWGRAQQLVNDAQADGMITIPTKERLEYLIASDPIIQVSMKVHYNKNNLRSEKISKINSLKQLRPFKVIDYRGDGWAESNLGDYNVAWAPNYTSAVWMIAANRGDIFLDDPISIKYHVKRQLEIRPALSGMLLLITEGENIILSAPHCLLIQKHSKYVSILKEFNTALQEIKDDGEYDKIISKYL